MIRPEKHRQLLDEFFRLYEEEKKRVEALGISLEDHCKQYEEAMKETQEFGIRLRNA